MLSKQFAKNASFLLKEDFSTLDQIQQLFTKPIVTKNLDEEQIWAQLDVRVQQIIQQAKRDIQKLEAQGIAIADAQQDYEKDENNEELAQESEENDVQEEEEEEISNDYPTETIAKIANKSKKQSKKEERYEFEEFEKYMEDIEEGKIDVEEEEDEEDEEDQQDNEEDDDNQGTEGENSVFDEMREMDEDPEIENLEQKLLQKKDWQMKGEVNARQRPVNSLLDENVDFQVNLNKVRVEDMVTEEYQKLLEDVIKKRVQDELFDDRQKVQFSQVLQDTFANKKEVDTNKSQFGLAEIYERQFKTALGLPTNTTEQKLKQEVFQQFRELCYKLDSLSNLNFEPRGFIKQGEIKVTGGDNLALNREEKVPLTLAGLQSSEIPDKVQQQKGSLGFISKEEAEPDDNKRKRRAVKQRLRNKLKDQKRKGLVKQLETKGQTKFMHNQAQKGMKKLQKLQSKIKNQESVKFDKTSKFFKNLQEHEPSKKQKK